MKIPDLYQIEALFSTDQLEQRDWVRRFVNEKIVPQAARWYEERAFPLDLVKPMADLGLFGGSIVGYGCPHHDPITHGLMMQELERGDSAFRSFCSVQTGLAMYPIHAFGTEEQKQRWLPKMARGEAIGCFALTEPEHGSDPAGLETTARQDGDHYVLNGHKRWCTNAPIADVAIIWAKLNGKTQGFLVEKGTPGFQPKEIRNKLSLRISVSSEILIENCRIPKENVLPSAKGLRAALLCLNQARYSIAWGVIGAALACFEEVCDYLVKRQQFGKPLAQFQLVQEKLADMWTGIVQAQLLVYRLGQMMAKGSADPAAISLAKRSNVRMALFVARNCRDLLGAVGILNDFVTMRHLNNLESVFTYEGTDHIHTLILGEKLTGLAAFE